MHENTIGRRGQDPFDALIDVLAAVNRYDLALGVIPIAFVITLVAASVFGVPAPYAFAAAAIVGIGVIADVCYLNPPVDQGSTDRTDDRTAAD
ncbi:hypothetical protein C491_06583 [Natronococcus amylolyticus DSM 10524]|uniref:Uncharacterized protein n=1 Tax=Natronococcus amylolyticus DSM 10524 TaxID=1227497 RepID=L9XCK0_9EURY|nr:hypothetical protein [Natronococcus amylolyticus]ELY59455.1 hypothetical protein C491_06583 [Natronococcus amylolyticus DSM 10524]